MNQKKCGPLSRRHFLAQSAASAAIALTAPTALTRAKSTAPIITGQGDHRYEVQHDWAQLPDKFSWQTTHNVAVDQHNFLYVIHEGKADLKEHPAIFVFDPEGKYVRSFGNQFQGGGHGIEVRKEGNQEYLYVCAYQQVKSFAKLDLHGEVVWQQFTPMDSGVYAAGEDTNPQKIWGRDRFMPTNFAFLHNGGFLLADGYGSFTIHRYDANGQWKSCFGGPGDGKGTFNTPHGIWIDDRNGRDPTVVICDRAHHTLQRLSVSGEHQQTLEGYGLPANADTWHDLMVVPELFGRVTILDGNNDVVARLGDDAERIRADTKRQIRGDTAQWQSGRFVHPHDACFDNSGNIFVAEWVATGRISRLKRLV